MRTFTYLPVSKIEEKINSSSFLTCRNSSSKCKLVNSHGLKELKKLVTLVLYPRGALGPRAQFTFRPSALKKELIHTNVGRSNIPHIWRKNKLLPSCEEHSKDAIANRIDILMDASCEPDSHKSFI